MKENKGITLIALVITIIVLLILAGIAIAALTGDNGILSRATEARAANAIGEAKDKCAIIVAEETEKFYKDAYVTQTGTADISGLDTAIVTALNAQSSTLANGVEATITGTGTGAVLTLTYTETNATATGTISGGVINWTGTNYGGTTVEESSSARAQITPAPTTGDTYTAGEEVTFGGEQFFVVSDDGTTVKLLAKYCLSKTENTQLTKDATYSDYGRSFSSTNYWSSDSTSSPFDLQGEYLANHPLSAAETTANNAILKAQAYGTAKGVTGRLMTKAEADAMVSSNSAIMYGRWTGDDAPTEGWLVWWLGAAFNANFVWSVNGSSGYLNNDYYYDTDFGVRPVLVVSES